MKIKQYHTVNEYWSELGDFLMTNPVKHNIVIGQLASTLDRNKVLTNNSVLNKFQVVKNKRIFGIYSQ